MLPVYFDDLELRSRAIFGVPYVFGSVCPRDAPIDQLKRYGLDCAQAAAWEFGPWVEIPDFTGSLFDWSKGLGLQVPVDQRRPGDLLLRAPKWLGIAIGHVGVVMRDVNVCRQARSTKDGCGDWPVSATKWETAVRMNVVLDKPASVDLVAVAAAMAQAKSDVTAHPLQLMSTGLPVKIVQQKLGAAQSGTYDYSTVAMVSAFQQWWNGHRREDQPLLDVDGVVGPQTWLALFGPA